MKGKLYLVPVTLGHSDYSSVIPGGVLNIINNLRRFLVEDIRSARRFLRMINTGFPIDECEFIILNKHTSREEYDEMLSGLAKGCDTGLMSEAGIPGVADPGSSLVLSAHMKGYRVIPLTGPSSIFLALMSSGLNGQDFAFNGYLPVKRAERIKQIKKLEAIALRGQSQIFMETPYRNMKILHDLGTVLGAETYLCIAAGISHPDEYIVTRQVSEWLEKGFPDIDRKPAIFIIG